MGRLDGSCRPPSASSQAWLCLPLARRYGPPGAAWWLATLGAFGTLLFPMAIEGNFYYLAHLEAMAATFVALIEWRGQRRPSIIAGALGVAALARPTVLLAAIPFGLALVWGSRARLLAAAQYAAPLAAAVALMAAYDDLRFGSPTETGYATSVLRTPGLTPSEIRASSPCPIWRRTWPSSSAAALASAIPSPGSWPATKDSRSC